ncbi:choice-of-anchor L domain-containing protein [Agromyces sp. GXS1127]|uniref:choice-of-anchor L domain-containing protein n=1 Tax=Agromyces sp. GXS1127 TaxID=3424181 RepID=UPI003D323644
MQRTRTTAIAVAGISLAALIGGATPAVAIGSTAYINPVDPAALAQTLVGGDGVAISNVTYVGDPISAGSFSGGDTSVGFGSGVVLASGDIADTVGPTNDATDTQTVVGTGGDADLTTLAGFPTFDAAVMEFDFTVPAGATTIYFRYTFGSEEYNEWVNSEYNDVFAFYVNGVNCAVVPDPAIPGGTLPVAVNSVNNGNPGGDPTATNPDLYRDNTASPNPLPTELDGVTDTLTCMAPVDPTITNHMKLAIADASDSVLDSAVFIEAGSLAITPPAGSGKVTGGGRLDLADGAVTFGTTVIRDEQGLRGNLQVNDHRTGDRFHGYDVLAFSQSGNEATWSGDGRFNGEDGYSFEVTVVDNRNGNSAKKGSPDTISIVITDGSGATVWSLDPAVQLPKGNIVVHQ